MSFKEKIINTAKILIVDDEENNLVVLERLLRQAGYSDIHCTTDSRMTMRLYDQLQLDLIFLDLHMPEPNGFDLLEQLSARRPAEGLYVPVLVLTADVTPGAKLKALGLGANDFLTKPIERCELLLRTRNLLRTRFLYRALVDESSALEDMTRRAASADAGYRLVLDHVVKTGDTHEIEEMLREAGLPIPELPLEIESL